MSNTHNIGGKIRAARRAAGVSQEELAQILGITQSAISRMEKNDYEASATQLIKIANVLGVSVTSLMPGISEDGNRYDNLSTSAIQSDYNAPPGLRAFASDRSLLKAMSVTTEELDLLHAMPLKGISKDGYVQLLITIRAVSGK
ncbi:helix-turn-helix domain-containing protein [Thiolapillus sp.]